jgi:hypothetical protein
MAFVAPSAASTSAFVAIVAAVLFAAVRGYRDARRRLGLEWRRETVRLAAILFGWVAWLSVPAGTGYLEANPFPGTLLFLLVCLGGGIGFGASRFGGTIARGLPLAALVGFQAFRLPLELVLHSWAGQGSIPETMTWTGSNFDVVTGVVAIVCALGARRSVAFAWLANAVGIALLVNVGRVAVLSSPVPFGWGVEPALQLAYHLPFAWIASVCVAGAAAGHVVLTRALLERTQESRASSEFISSAS